MTWYYLFVFVMLKLIFVQLFYVSIVSSYQFCVCAGIISRYMYRVRNVVQSSLVMTAKVSSLLIAYCFTTFFRMAVSLLFRKKVSCSKHYIEMPMQNNKADCRSLSLKR